jgi:hypothetical protein
MGPTGTGGGKVCVCHYTHPKNTNEVFTVTDHKVRNGAAYPPNLAQRGLPAK